MKIWERGAALTSRFRSFETELLTQEENLIGLMAINRELLAQAELPTRADRIVLDMLVKHASYCWWLLAEGHLHRRLFGEMLRRISALPVPTG